MSLQSWKEEFYPVEAQYASPEEAVAHSLRKWEGLRPENLQKHGLVQNGKHLEEVDSEDEEYFISGDSCALCHHYAEDECNCCPLFKARGDVACDSFNIEECGSDGEHPFGAGVNRANPNPEPMIMWLKKAQEEQQ